MTSSGAPQDEMSKLTLDTAQKEIHELPLDTSQKTISNPIIPYVGTIHGGLVPGELIVIHGTVPDDADRFQVDLQCGSSIKPRADVAFHFNPRFKRSGCIVCNTLEREKWGWEEITYEMPFGKGKAFEIVIMILKDKFQVTVNKKHLLLYNHRISLEKIDTLGIYGKVQIKTIEFVSKSLQGPQPSSLGVTKISTENGEMPNGSQLISVCTSGSGMQVLHLGGGTCTQLTWTVDGVSAHLFAKTCAGELYPYWSKDYTQTGKGLKPGIYTHRISPHSGESEVAGVPYVGKLDTALRPGCTITIKGEVNKNPKSFAINLRPSDSKDIALHLNPRMKNKVFVRNSYLHDSWGEEEKEVANFPFSPRMYFELIIFCDADQFKVAVNGVHTLEYKHRFKQLEKINRVEVTGDVHLLDVSFQSVLK